MSKENTLPSIFDTVVDENKNIFENPTTHHYLEVEQSQSEDEELKEIVIDKNNVEDIDDLLTDRPRINCNPLSSPNKHSIEDLEAAVADLEEAIGVTRQPSIKVESQSNITTFCNKFTNSCTNSCSIQ